MLSWKEGTRKEETEDFQGQKIEDKIVIRTLTEEIIKNQVEEGEVQEKLLAAAQELQNIKKIDFYTDGSLYEEKATPQKVKIGAGWTAIIKHGETEEEEKTRFSCAFKDWPSSTRAELGAIWTASLVAPEGAEIIVHTDSLAAIQSLKRKEVWKKERKALKIKNASILWQIEKLWRIKDLKVKLKKVKGHSGDRYNDIADKLAKEGARDQKLAIVKWPWTQHLRISARWRDITVDSPIREVVNKITIAALDAEWADLDRNSRWLDRSEEEELD
jgi:ribonuclease HI